MLAALALAGLDPAGCGSSTLECGEGTHELDGVCVADPVDPPADDDDATPEPLEAPDLPEFNDVIDHLTVAVRTASGIWDGTDGNELSLCLSAEDCFSLETADVNNFRPGWMDSFQFDEVGVPRARVDRVQLRSVNGADRWRPSCLELRFDGEPVYCSQLEEVDLGNDDDELTRWTDPQGLHEDCDTCWDSVASHPPMLGAVGPDRVRLLVRGDATRNLAVRMGPLGDEAPVVAWLQPDPAQDFATQHEVTGLQADTEYVYWVEHNGSAVTDVFSFRTAPPVGEPARWSLALGSSARQDSQSAFSAVTDMDPEVLLLAGDAHWADTPVRAAHRWEHRFAMAREARGAAMATRSTLVTWDDHDYLGLHSGGDAPGRAEALQAFREYRPNPGFGLPDSPGVFFATRWADVDLFVLDVRSWREDGQMLGAAQNAWLREQLAASTATFKLLVSPSQWTAQDPEDTWAEFPDERDALFDFFREAGIGGVVLLSGDANRSEFRALPRASGYTLPEVTSAPLASWRGQCGDDPEVVACYAGSNNFVLLDFDTTAPDPWVEATIFDADGTPHHSWTVLRSDLEDEP